MTLRLHDRTFSLFAVVLIIGLAVPHCWVQSARTAAQSASSSGKPVSHSRNETERALQVLARLRALRDCWADPYMIITGDDSRFENDSLYLRCGSEYALRLAELQDSIEHTLRSIKNPTMSREAIAAMKVFNDLDTLHNLFNSRGNFMRRDVLVSDIYPIVRRYNVPYQGNRISKVALYQAIVPSRRSHIDKFATLITGARPDSNPTLSPTEIAAAVDELDWSVVTRQGQGHEWYLRRHPQGLHAKEALRIIQQHGTVQLETASQFATLKEDLSRTTHELINAYVRGDKVALDRLFASNFPSRQLHIERLRAQPKVVSFEINNLEVQPVSVNNKIYRVEVDVQYRSSMGQQREYHNTILYQRIEGSWRTIDWRSP